MPSPSGRSIPRWISSWIPVVLYAALIYGLSSIAQPPPLPGGPSDKVLHLLLYAGFGLVLLRACAGGRLRGITTGAVIAALLIAAAYAASDEWHQAFVPGRTPDVRDWVADIVGAGLAAVALVIFVRLRARP